MKKLEEFTWVEKYRPHTVADTILPDRLKKKFQAYVDSKELPTLLLVGSPGTGKTTIAKAMVEELGGDYMVINGSLNGNIDTLRNDIQSFASSMSIAAPGKRKTVILDEADHLTPATQPALRNFMEEFSRTCGFILTCNWQHRIIEPLQSRSAVVNFKTRDENEAVKTQMKFLKRVEGILNENEVPFSKPVLAQVISNFFPDQRKTLNELQAYAKEAGEIDTGILSTFSDCSIDALVDFMKAKNYTSTRKWVGENVSDHVAIYRRLYDSASQLVTPSSIPMLVLIIGRYQYQSTMAVDQEINLAACLAELMVEMEWL